jgi:hypothetical protein
MPLSPKQLAKIDAELATVNAQIEKQDRRFVQLCRAYDIAVPVNHPTLGKYVEKTKC